VLDLGQERTSVLIRHFSHHVFQQGQRFRLKIGILNFRPSGKKKENSIQKYQLGQRGLKKIKEKVKILKEWLRKGVFV